MAPRIMKVKATQGLIHFNIGIQEFQIQEFLNRNNIKRIKNSPEYMTTENLVTIQVPPAAEYIVPDDVYIWLHSGD